MKVLIKEQLSEHKSETPEGYLICVDAILARTGKQTYTRDEVFGDGSQELIEVDREPKEVFDETTLASFENKPVTIEHPDENVTIDNIKDYAVGFVRDVRKGRIDGEDVILGNLVIQDKDAINLIKSGEYTELSCGYNCEIEDETNPKQTKIRGNHLALCQNGRAGIARIQDSEDTEITDSIYHLHDTVNEDNAHKMINQIYREISSLLGNTFQYAMLDAINHPDIFHVRMCMDFGSHADEKAHKIIYNPVDWKFVDTTIRKAESIARQFSKFFKVKVYTDKKVYSDMMHKDMQLACIYIETTPLYKDSFDDTFAFPETDEELDDDELTEPEVMNTEDVEIELEDLNAFDVDMLYKKLQDAEIYVDKNQKELLGSYTLDECKKMLEYVKEFTHSQGLDQYDAQVQLNAMLKRRGIKHSVGWIRDSKMTRDERILNLIKDTIKNDVYETKDDAYKDIYKFMKNNFNNKKFIIRVGKENFEYICDKVRLSNSRGVEFEIIETKQQAKKKIDDDTFMKLEDVFNSTSSQNPYRIIANAIRKQFKTKLYKSFYKFYAGDDIVYWADNGEDEYGYPAADCYLLLFNQ